MAESTTIREQKLAEEILQAQNSRSSLLQWKLLSIGALGAAGLGLTHNSAGTATSYIALLSLIPPVCVYVDLLCTNLNLRMILIGKYFAEVHKDPYEAFVVKHRGWFALEDWALYWSTFIASAAVGLLALVNLLTPPPQSWCSRAGCCAVLISSVGGPMLTYMTKRAAEKQLTNAE
jgi:hypothetical protein